MGIVEIGGVDGMDAARGPPFGRINRRHRPRRVWPIGTRAVSRRACELRCLGLAGADLKAVPGIDRAIDIHVRLVKHERLQEDYIKQLWGTMDIGAPARSSGHLEVAHTREENPRLNHVLGDRCMQRTRSRRPEGHNRVSLDTATSKHVRWDTPGNGYAAVGGRKGWLSAREAPASSATAPKGRVCDRACKSE